MQVSIVCVRCLRRVNGVHPSPRKAYDSYAAINWDGYFTTGAFDDWFKPADYTTLATLMPYGRKQNRVHRCTDYSKSLNLPLPLPVDPAPTLAKKMKSDFKADIESSGSTKHRQRRQRGAPRGVKATLLKGEDVDGFSRFERVIRTTNDFREIEIVLKVFDLGEYSDLEIRAIVPIQNMVRNRQARHRLRWIGKMREEAIRQRDAALKFNFAGVVEQTKMLLDTIAKRDERKKEKEACIRIQTRYRIVLAKRVLTDRQALAHQRELDRQKRQAEIAIAEEERKKRTQGVVIRIVEAENIKKADRFGNQIHIARYIGIMWKLERHRSSIRL